MGRTKARVLPCNQEHLLVGYTENSGNITWNIKKKWVSAMQSTTPK
jgi:hypothetical protein